MADDTVLLTQNIQMLTQALTALNQNMFNKTGGRSALVGSNSSVPGTSTRVGNSSDAERNTIKAIATNTLLNATMKSNTDTVKYLIKDSKKNITDLGRYTQMSAMYFKAAIKDFSVKQLDNVLPKKLNTYLEAHIKNGIVPQLKSFEDVVKLQKRANLQNIDAALKLVREYGNATTSIARQQHIRETIEQQTGFNLTELGVAARDDGKALKEHAGEISKGMAEFAAKMHQAEENWNKITKAGEILAGIAVLLGVDLYKAAIAAQQYGTEVTLKTIPQAALAGMTAEELIKTQNENIQAIHSSGITFDGFNRKLDDGASSLLLYTGSLQEGAKVTANIFGTFRKLSADGSKMEGFQAEQNALFKSMNRTLGVTAEQFTQMNDELTNNTAVQAQMYKVSSAQRLNLLKGMQLQVQQLALDGLTVEQSKKLVESLAEITGGKAKDRFKEAAQVQGVLGALGLGKEGQRAADIIRKGQRATPQELKELADIQATAQRSVSSQYAGGNQAKEFQLDALTDVISKFLGPNSAGAQVATSQGKAVDTQTAAVLGQTNALMGLSKENQDRVLLGEKTIQVVEAGFKGVLTALKDLIALMIGGKLLGGIKDLFKFGAGGAEGLGGLGSAGGAALASTVATAATAALAAGAVATAGYSLYKAIKGEDASNFISNLDDKYLGLGSKITDGFEAMHDFFAGSPNNPANATDQYKASKIAQDKADIKALETGPQDENTALQIATLTEEVKKLSALQAKHLEETKKQTQKIVEGNQQAAAQADDQTKATKEIKETRTSQRAPNPAG